jgi:DNA-binding transcriptional MerR regulator
VAYTVDGVQYLYIEEMAGHAYVSEHQLRHWDNDGTLKPLRVRDIVPGIKGKIEANRRLYPYTTEMVETIKALASRKKQRASHLGEGEYTRAEAAAVLHVSYRTLQRMEELGEARPIRPDRKPIYTQEEIHRLAGLVGEQAKGD